jgi:hypothetical protein
VNIRDAGDQFELAQHAPFEVIARGSLLDSPVDRRAI